MPPRLSNRRQLHRIEIKPKPSSALPTTSYLARISPARVLAIVSLWSFVLYTRSYSHLNRVRRTPQLRASVFASHYRSSNGASVVPPLKPAGATVGGVEVFYMLPDNPVRGILVHFHGCRHSGFDFFLLPEDRMVVHTALNRDLAVLSITSNDREMGCWTQADVNLIQRKDVLGKWMKKVGLDHSLPVMGMGASSGGNILFSMWKVLGFKSMAAYIIPGAFDREDLVRGISNGHNEVKVPPTAFVHMPRDAVTAGLVLRSSEELRDSGVETLVLEAKPHPFTATLCASHLPEIGDRRCQAFVERVQKSRPELLSDSDLSVRVNSDAGQWDSVLEKFHFDAELRHYVGSGDYPRGTVPPANFHGHSWLWAAVEQEVATCYGMHEMTAEHRGEILDFLCKNANILPRQETKRNRGPFGQKRGLWFFSNR